MQKIMIMLVGLPLLALTQLHLSTPAWPGTRRHSERIYRPLMTRTEAVTGTITQRQLWHRGVQPATLG